MTHEGQDWLPVGIASRKVVRSQLDAVVEDWSADWFARKRFAVSKYVEMAGDPLRSLVGEPWYRPGRQVAFRQQKGGSARLAEAALDVSLSSVLSQADACLLDAFNAKLVGDLVQRVERALGVQAAQVATSDSIVQPYGRFGGLEVNIADGLGPDSLVLAIPLEALLPFTKTSAPPGVTRSEPGSRAAAIAPLPVKVEATIGHAEVLLGELSALGPGDVVVLGPARGHIVDLSLAGSPTIFAQAHLMERDGSMALVLQAHSQ